MLENAWLNEQTLSCFLRVVRNLDLISLDQRFRRVVHILDRDRRYFSRGHSPLYGLDDRVRLLVWRFVPVCLPKREGRLTVHFYSYVSFESAVVRESELTDAFRFVLIVL